MKSNNVAKRLGLASLCLVTAISAFSGIKTLSNNVATAESGTIQTTDLFYTTASVSKEKRNVYTGTNVATETDCLRLSSDESYSAMFKRVFKGETTLRFNFPETDTAAGVYGNFTFRIADATNDANYFEVEYYPIDAGNLNLTGACVIHNEQIRTNKTTKGSVFGNAGVWQTTKKQTASDTGYQVAPAFLTSNKTKAVYSTREGALSLRWDDDKLSVFVNSTYIKDATDNHWQLLCAFDGTTTFKSGTSWNMPKMSFADGYTISFSSNKTSTYGARDVSFSKIENGDIYDKDATLTSGTTITFANDTIEKDELIQKFETDFVEMTEEDIPNLAADEVFLGWRNTKTNLLYPTHSFVRANECQPLTINFDTVNGASVRIAGRSGIRFQTLFDPAQYTTIKEAGYIQSFGTLIAYTDTLTTVGKEFTIENYQDQDTFAIVQNTKGVFDYTDKNSKTYKAYTAAIVDIADYTKAYSARGYLVVQYANGMTHTVYTDYSATDNSRSIAEVANRLKTNNAASYNAMTDAQKAVIDAYAKAAA